MIKHREGLPPQTETKDGAGALSASLEARLRAEIETLRLLIEVNEATAVAQTAKAELACLEALSIAETREEQRLFIRDIIRAGADAVIVLDEEYRVTFMNEQATQLIEHGENPFGRTLTDVFPEIATSAFWARYERVMEERIPIAFDDTFEPEHRWFQVNASPVGKGIALYVRDITERHRRDAMLARTEKLAAVGRMASSISHEINNPLESVTNLLYLIQHSPTIDHETRSYANLASSELSRVSHIVAQTLKFHRQTTHATSSRASEILESVLALFQGRVTTLGATVETRYAQGDSMTCFAGDMRQVFANLIGNALDAISPHGNLWIRTRRVSFPSTGVRVTVADNGSGMSPATQHSLFEAFFTTKPSTGTGLGLWVSHEIIRNHKGTVHWRSRETPGRSGTVFCLFFPA
jgi:signal transduction histidine kinase